ncbi:DUF6758 family protein [Actinomadura flavalba]|uniref:DUF6758 family protein n=1 Tax=Actinomadura flavalba TaxID=1120938 RepID=UPI000369AE39|nr:DUF6758 family protein [Actinomadura flavalba]
MSAEVTCPRCAAELRPPDARSADWTCGEHGAVLPRRPSEQPGQDALDEVLRHTHVPVWAPWPLPRDWLVTGFGSVGDERGGARAVAVALSGPGLLTGSHDLILVAEEPGIGLGAHFAGLPGTDPGPGFDRGAALTKLAAAGRSVPLWPVAAPSDRAAYVGEALGNWLWAVLWPAEAGVLLLEASALLDLREPGFALDLPYGPLSPRLTHLP